MKKEKIKSWYGYGGSLITNEEVPGGDFSQKLPDDHAKFYGGKFFIAESMTLAAAEEISRLLDLDFQGEADET